MRSNGTHTVTAGDSQKCGKEMSWWMGFIYNKANQKGND